MLANLGKFGGGGTPNYVIVRITEAKGSQKRGKKLTTQISRKFSDINGAHENK
jgi:hypothetical protein